MPTATRIDTEMSHWCPVTRHYSVDGGYLAVTLNKFLTAEGTDVFYADENGGAISLTPIAQFPEGTTHDQALEQIGYTVIDEIGPEPEPEPDLTPQPDIPSVFDILPPEIVQVIAAASAASNDQGATA